VLNRKDDLAGKAESWVDTDDGPPTGMARIDPGRIGKNLRQQAEEIMRDAKALSLKDLEAMTPYETLRMLQELQVHQIELEMQNEELRQAQVTLAQTRARYADLYDLAPVSYVTVSRQGLILEVNLTAAGLLGVPRSALAGQPMTRFIQKEFQDAYYLFHKLMLETGKPQLCELLMAKNDATPFWARLLAATEYDSSGVSEYQLVLYDFTEARRAEETLRKSENLFRNLFESQSAINLLLDAETGDILDANETAVRFYGWPLEELKQMNIRQINMLPPEALAFEMAQAKCARCNRFEFSHRRTDGSIREVEVFSNKIEFAGKNILFSSIHDITERNRARESLRKSEERYRVLAETMLQGVVHQDAKGMIVAMNQAAVQILGKNRDQFLGSVSQHEDQHTIRENGEPFPASEHPSMVALQTGQPVRGVIMGVFNPQIGDYRWLSIDAVPLFSQGASSPSEVYTVFEDITERKEAEKLIEHHIEELRASNEELEIFNNAAVKRELRMIDLKREINELCEQAGKPHRYPPDFDVEPL
jgi:PAS domain S-box-containing protein